ncbi:hypothetical protein AB3N62_11020 [Leptospira sp. WS4.C2]
MLNSREEAFGFWITVLFFYLILTKEGRIAALKLTKNLLEKKIIIILLIIILYLGLTISLLNYLQLWNFSQAKNTTLWFLTYVFSAISKLISAKNKYSFFKDTFLESFKLVVIVEFLSGLYTFPFVIEIFLLPVVVYLFLINLITETKKEEEYTIIYKFTNKLLILIGIVIITYSINKIHPNYDTFINKDNLIEFTTPILLTLFFIPFLFFLNTFIAYENTFNRIDRLFINKKFNRNVKLKVIKTFHFKTTWLLRWISHLSILDNPSQNLDLSFKHIKEFQTNIKENQNRIIQLTEGWNPHLAKDFLKEEEIETEYYRKFSEEDYWTALSPQISISKGNFPNNISYYIHGNPEKAFILKLVLHVGDTHNKFETLKEFNRYVNILFFKAIGYQLSKSFSKSLKVPKSKEEFTDLHHIKLEKIQWKGSITKGFTLKFTIRNRKFSELEHYA